MLMCVCVCPRGWHDFPDGFDPLSVFTWLAGSGLVTWRVWNCQCVQKSKLKYSACVCAVGVRFFFLSLIRGDFVCCSSESPIVNLRLLCMQRWNRSKLLVCCCVSSVRANHSPSVSTVTMIIILFWWLLMVFSISNTKIMQKTVLYLVIDTCLSNQSHLLSTRLHSSVDKVIISQRQEILFKYRVCWSSHVWLAACNNR